MSPPLHAPRCRRRFSSHARHLHPAGETRISRRSPQPAAPPAPQPPAPRRRPAHTRCFTPSPSPPLLAPTTAHPAPRASPAYFALAWPWPSALTDRRGVVPLDAAPGRAALRARVQSARHTARRAGVRVIERAEPDAEPRVAHADAGGLAQGLRDRGRLLAVRHGRLPRRLAARRAVRQRTVPAFTRRAARACPPLRARRRRSGTSTSSRRARARTAWPEWQLPRADQAVALLRRPAARAAARRRPTAAARVRRRSGATFV